MDPVNNSTSSEVTGGSVVADIMLSQGIEGPSDAELRGDDDSTEETTETKTEETSTESTETDTDTDTDTKTEETEEDKSTTEEDTASSEPKVEKAPKGFVPLAAVHEARGEIKYLKEQIQTLQEQMRESRSKPADKDEPADDDFEVLSDEAFEDLAEDNPAQAAIYLRKLNAYEAKQRAKADEQRRTEEFSRVYDAIIDNSVAEIEKVAPGIFDENSTVQKELMEFAGEIGFSEDLYYLTNPSTKIILPGETEPLLLGEQAASILGILVNAKSKMKAPDTSELEKKLRAEITAEVMKKFKHTDPDAYRSINQVPKAESETPDAGSFKGKVLTTKQLEKLSPAEYEAYLAGD